MLQEYEEAILRGEYSLAFINSKHTLTVLSVPGSGDFRTNHQYGATFGQVDHEKVPIDAQRIGQLLSEHLDAKFGDLDGLDNAGKARKKLVHLRIDGVVRENGQFILGEAELIEPHLWLDRGGKFGLDALYNALFAVRV